MDVNLKPRIGMEFESLEVAWRFWVDYGGRMGFGVRKQYFNKSKKDGSITSYRYVCCKEGKRKADKRDYMVKNPRLETRTDCKARMGVTLVNGKYQVHDFVEEHNHPLHLQEAVHMLASQRKISKVQAHEIDLAEDSGLGQKASFELMSRHAGGRANLGFTRLDAKNYLQSKKQRSMLYGEAGCLLQYFQRQLLENPSFYHAYQMDVEEQITNVFWADAKMRLDYGYFGDVASLDTTYCTNRANRPLAIFSGFNHYRGAVIFGAALLYDESTESFKWLFETFLEAHMQKKPQTIFTDQDQAMAKALQEVMPETSHGLCTWHLMQNGIKHLGNLMKDGSHFLTDFKLCMYEYEEEMSFEIAWSELLSKYKVDENAWLRSMYNLKEKWAACHMKKVFTLGMRSTQLSESVNSDMKSCMKPSLDIIQFFNSFERVVEDKRYNELKWEFEMRQKIPRLKMESSPMLRQLVQIYTTPIFDLFQQEYDLHAAAYIIHKNEVPPLFEFVVGMVDQEGKRRVLFDPSNKSISCSCKKFDTFGIICCHALKVLFMLNINTLPKQYILKRWTKEGRSGVIHDIKGKEVEEDPKRDRTQRYKQLCPMLIRLATEASDCPEAFSLVQQVVLQLSQQVNQLCLLQKSSNNNIDANTTLVSNQIVPQVKGFKNKSGIKRSRRLKSWVELQHKRKRATPRVNEAQSQIPCGISCSAPSANESEFTFTGLMMVRGLRFTK